MHYYMLAPVLIPDGHSLDMSVGEEAASNIIESAYWKIMDEVKVHDQRITKDHDDFLIFANISSLRKAVDIIQHYRIQVKANIVEKTDKENADFQSDKNYYKVLVFNEPKLDITTYPKTYTKE